MINEDFATCNVCGEIITSDADTVSIKKYCRLCGMPTEDAKRFCCRKCEVLYKRYVNGKRDQEKTLRKNN